MKKIIIQFFVLASFMLAFQQIEAQTVRIVKINGINPKDTTQTNHLVYDQIYTAIVADAPNRVDGVITKYELQRGQVYLNVSSLSFPFDLYLISSPKVSGADAQKNYNPVILASLTTTGGSNTLLKPLKNLYLENVELDGLLPNGKLPARIIEINGLGSTVSLIGCKIQNNSQAHITIMVDDVSLFISDCLIGNSGHLQGYGGNGRTIDNRAPARVKQIVIQNSTCYNNTDRFIRSMLGQSIKKFKLDHVSLFNSTGRHGCFQLARADTIEITNNMIVNPLSFGDRVPNTLRTPVITYREEQTQSDKAFAVFTHDSTKVGQPVTQVVTMRNNNIYHEKKFEDFFNQVTAPFDSLQTVRVLNNCLAGWVGSNATNTHWFREELNFNNISSSDDLLAYVKEWNLHPKSATFTAYNFSKIFPFEYDGRYSTTSKSYTAGDNGFPLGDLNAWPERKTQWHSSMQKAPRNSSQLSGGINSANCYPNPFNNQITIDFTLENDQTIEVSVFNSIGQKVKSLLSSSKNAGKHSIYWDGKNESGIDLKNGLYFLQISGANVKTAMKIIKY